MKSAALAFCLLLPLLGGCAGGSHPVLPTIPHTVGTPGLTASSVSSSPPASITIPALDISDSPLYRLLLDPHTHELAVPPVTSPQEIGWYAQGVRPGDVAADRPGVIGRAVIVAHVDGEVAGKAGQPGAFFHLKSMKIGDIFSVRRVDGRVLLFRVYRTEQISKGAFNTAEVYGHASAPEVVLLTCTGSWLGMSHGGYADNFEVYARLL